MCQQMGHDERRRENNKNKKNELGSARWTFVEVEIQLQLRCIQTPRINCVIKIG